MAVDGYPTLADLTPDTLRRTCTRASPENSALTKDL